MRGRRGLFSLFTSQPEQAVDEKAESELAAKRRRRHSSGGDRETWSRKVEYAFASLGYAVGLGNIWRFPYLCYRNGGGAFLIPYLLSLVAVGLPIMFMEMSFGQFASVGPITIWRISPLFKGIGFTIVVVMTIVNTYYNVLCAYALFYLFASITSKVPWSSCNNAWNTNCCIMERRNVNVVNGLNISSSNVTDHGSYREVYANSSVHGCLVKDLKTPTEEYFERHLLNMTSGIHELGDVQWPLIVCLAVSWATCFMCLFKGIKSMGKAVIFTTVFSYVILTVLLIRGASLPGAVDGVLYYIKPDFSKLGNLQVWGEASAQAFASLTLGGGGWITLSSYNKFHNNTHRDALLVGLGNALTSIYSGFVIFSVLGYMAHIKGIDVKYVTQSGPGVAFVAYPEGLSLIPGAPFWSICFFFMMFTVGLDSLFGQVETIAAAFIDEFPDYLRPRRKLLTLFLCCFMFCLGIPLVTRGGIYIVTLMDWYTLLFSFSFVSLTEIIAIIYVYGYSRFAEDIQMMIGRPPSLYYKVMWIGITPLVLVLVIAFLFANYVPANYGSYHFPGWGENIGWAFALCPGALIPLTMIFQFFYKAGGPHKVKSSLETPEARADLYERLVNPTMEWGPAEPEIRRKYSYDLKVRHTSGNSKDSKDDRGTELQDIKVRHDIEPHVKFQERDEAEKQLLKDGEEGQAQAEEKVEDPKV